MSTRITLACDLLEQFVGKAKRVVVVGHEHAALKVDDAIGDTAARVALVPAEARRSRRIVCRPQDAPGQRRLISVGRVHVVDDLALVPDVIAGGDDINAEFEQLFGYLRCDAEAAGGVFAVGDGEVDAVLLLQFRQTLVNDGAPGRPKMSPTKSMRKLIAVLG